MSKINLAKVMSTMARNRREAKRLHGLADDALNQGLRRLEHSYRFRAIALDGMAEHAADFLEYISS